MAGANKTKTRTPKRRSRKDNARATADAKKKAPRRRRSTQKNKAVKPDEPAPAETDDSDRDEPPPSSRRHGPTTPARRLDGILRALPERELGALVDRMGIRVDSKKRIDTPAQVARALVRLPDVREPGRLPGVSAELLRRIAEANGSLVVQQLPGGLEVLVRRGIVFAKVADEAVELCLPTAFLVQMKSWEGEDPRSLRALLADAPFETASAIATHYLGRPSTPPIALSLEPAWEVLGDPVGLREELERVSHQERRLLDQIEQIGGEVDTQELMDLEREPMRVRGAYGVAAGRRGAAFSLEKRGFLFPLHPNRYVIPREVAAIIGAERRREREARREEIRSHVVEEDYLPRRARFSNDPAPLAIAMLMALKESETAVKPGVGTPRSLLSRLAQRFGQEQEPTALVAALSRALGLWESDAVSAATPPGSFRLWELSAELFDAWRRGGAWDEARKEPEMLRVQPEHRDPSPVGVLREMVIDALQDLGEGQWVPYDALAAYIKADPRMGGLKRLFRRWAKRVGVRTPQPMRVAQRVLLESLPTMGVVDVGGADVRSAGNGELTSLALRFTSRGRRLVAGDAEGARGQAESEFVESRQLRVGADARVADVMGLVGFTEIGAIDNGLHLELPQSAISNGLSSGIQAEEMRQRLGIFGELPNDLDSALEQAGTVLGRASFAVTGGFLWIEDDEIRTMLANSSGTRDLFVDPSPLGGLLVGANVDIDKLVRRCRAIGVDVEVQEVAVRVRRSSMPPPKKSATRKSVSWRPPPTKKRKDGS